MIKMTPRDLATILREYTEPLLQASLEDHATLSKQIDAATKRAESLAANLRSAEKALAEKDAQVEKLRAALEAAEAECKGASSDRANLSAQLDAATKRAVQAEEALAAEKAEHDKTKAQVQIVAAARAKAHPTVVGLLRAVKDWYVNDRTSRLYVFASSEAAAWMAAGCPMPHAPQVGGPIDLQEGDTLVWRRTGLELEAMGIVEAEHRESDGDDLLVVRGTGPDARIIWTAEK